MIRAVLRWWWRRRRRVLARGKYQEHPDQAHRARLSHDHFAAPLVPATVDPHVPAAADLPATRRPDIAGTLGFVVTAAPFPATLGACGITPPKPVSPDPHEAGSSNLDLDLRSRRCFIDLDRHDGSGGTN